MKIQQMKSFSVEQLIDNYQKILGICPRETKLQILNNQEWQEFCNNDSLDESSEGIFLPRNLTAYIKENENSELSLFHEYFGHGLFCEYSKKGKVIAKLEKRLEKEEKTYFNNTTFSLEDLQKFRDKSSIFSLLKKEMNNNRGLYETFAIWTENYLSEKIGIKDKFEQKYREMPEKTRKYLERLLNFQKNFGELALFYESGMPKYYNKERIKGLLEDIFKGKIKSAQLILLYGSRKPYSDIDLFIVSNEIGNFSNEWIDIYSLTPEKFEKDISVFDISVTDPLLVGELIQGDNKYLENKKKQLTVQPITKEAIEYNLRQAKEHKLFAEKYKDIKEEVRRCESYHQTYLKNAIALTQGKRLLTKDSLLL